MILLEETLNTFLQNSKEDQILRKQQIDQSLKEKEKKEKVKNFEESCLINRKLIYNSIVYIINHYEYNIIAIQKKEEKYERFSSWTNLYAIHKLIINNSKEKIEYESIIDKQGCYPDEEYCGLSVNKDKDTDICFFDIKRKLSLIIEKSIYLKKFIKMIEEHYYKEKNITTSDIKNYLILLSNEVKIKKRVKKL